MEINLPSKMRMLCRTYRTRIHITHTRPNTGTHIIECAQRGDRERLLAALGTAYDATMLSLAVRYARWLAAYVAQLEPRRLLLDRAPSSRNGAAASPFRVVGWQRAARLAVRASIADYRSVCSEATTSGDSTSGSSLVD
jgi:hypothetical protein